MVGDLCGGKMDGAAPRIIEQTEFVVLPHPVIKIYIYVLLVCVVVCGVLLGWAWWGRGSKVYHSIYVYTYIYLARARIRQGLPHQQLDERGLARAVGPHHRHARVAG